MKELNDIFKTSDNENLIFEEMVINSDMMHIINELMIQHNIKSKAELAEKLDVSKAYISKLYSGDKMFNVSLLAKLQRLFKTKFIFNAKSLQSISSEKDKTKGINTKMFTMDGTPINEYYVENEFTGTQPNILKEKAVG